MKVLEVSRPLVAACSLGSARACVDMAVKYSKERVQFGKPICKFQAIQLMLADMEMRTNAARALVYNATRLIDEGKSCAMEAAMAKCYASDAYQKKCHRRRPDFGGYGTMKEYLIEKLYRDSKIPRLWRAPTRSSDSSSQKK
jgi:butyryl-CoA dehydrogenase